MGYVSGRGFNQCTSAGQGCLQENGSHDHDRGELFEKFRTSMAVAEPSSVAGPSSSQPSPLCVRAIASSAGSLLTALAVTPLDVVKVRTC